MIRQLGQFVAFVSVCVLGFQILILYAGGLQIRLNIKLGQLVASVALCALGLQILILDAGGLQIRLNMKLLRLVAFVALCALGFQILILYEGGLQIRLNMANPPEHDKSAGTWGWGGLVIGLILVSNMTHIGR